MEMRRGIEEESIFNNSIQRSSIEMPKPDDFSLFHVFCSAAADVDVDDSSHRKLTAMKRTR